MNTIQEIQQAIRRLSRFEREDLAEWILNSEDFGDRVAEAGAAYGELLEQRHFSVEEYLKREEQSPIKHEYVAGEIFAMSGVKVRHNVIADELVRHFNNHFDGGPCRAFSSNVKVHMKVNQDEIFYYPDVTVACGPQDMESHFLTNARLIVEVLSRSTERIDRSEKALNYRHIPSLEEYVLVAQRNPEVTIYRRTERWVPVVVTSTDAVAELRSIGLAVPLERIYKGAR